VFVTGKGNSTSVTETSSSENPSVTESRYPFAAKGEENMTPLWLADPLNGVVVWGSAGIVAWSIIAVFVGSLLGILRDTGCARIDRESHVPQLPQGTRRRPGPQLATTTTSPQWRPAT
jgi:hypothetical protein